MAGRRYGESEARTDRLEVHRRGFLLASVACVAMAAATLAEVALAWVALASRPEPRYFAAREDGGVVPIVAVSQPFLTDVQITNFTVEPVTAAMTMDFANWREDLSEASGYFEKPGGASGGSLIGAGCGASLDAAAWRACAAAGTPGGIAWERGGCVDFADGSMSILIDSN